jgi:co-chaperonin GroES (HSP10)
VTRNLPVESTGVRLDRVATDIVSHGTLRPLRDHIIVKPLPWQPSATIQIAGDKRKPLRGIVTAVGPGCYPWRYNKDRSKRWLSKQLRPTEVKVGDMVELGGLEIGGYSFQQVMIGTEMHIICREADVCGIHDQS